MAAIAPLLLLFIPRGLLEAPGEAADVAESTARLLYEAEAVPVPARGFVRAAALEALSYRALYAREAVRRLSGTVVNAESGKRAETLRKALVAERRHLGAHVEATRRRMAGARATEAMIELFGPVLTWRWGETRTPDEPRPHHKAADGAQFDLRRGVPRSTGSLPGVEPGCSCAWGPPVVGARMLN